MNDRSTKNVNAGSRRDTAAEAFDELTAALILDRHRRGELDPAIVAALLQGVGFKVPQ